jgi:hypothetical protein
MDRRKGSTASLFACLKVWALLLSGRAVIVHRVNKNAFHKEGVDLAT